MNNTIKRIVPILLAIAIIISIGWYLLVYDRTFTRDVMLNFARISDSYGYQTMAGLFYDVAYKCSGNDEAVAIELAKQYKDDGNYTKAEKVLTNAISNGGTAELYIALSKTYVEQDKLLDAVNMLNNITNPTVKAELDMLRPSAPAAMPEAGFYSQYIPVSLSSNAGTVYFTTTGEYPSLDGDVYSEPVVLPGGTTNIYTVSVAENGLVSPVTILAYTIGGVIEPVTFADAAMETAVRELLQVDAEDALYTNDLWAITEFTVPAEASVYTDLALMPYLKKLTIEDTTLDTLAHISSMIELEELSMKSCRFPYEDLSIVSALPALKKLTLSSCNLSTIAGLENAANLTYLDLSNNTLRNLTSLTDLVALEEINLQHNAVVDLSALSQMENLKTLDVSYNSITTLSPLTTCTNLSYLNAGNNAIATLSAVDALVSLKYLNLNNNSLTDASLLGKCTSLTELHISNNDLKNITMLSALTSLEVLDFAHNSVYEVPIWPEGTPLRTLDGSYNSISNIDTLWKMEKLTYIYMDYNNITSLRNLANMPNLVQVNVYGNPLEDLSGLEARNIIVNYDPTA